MNILVTGINGQVGWEIARQGAARGINISGLTRAQFDIGNEEAVHRAVQGKNFDIVINAAAYTAVDKAESDADEAFRVNRDGAAFIAAACQKAFVPLIHISTDYVFDGCSRTPYREDDSVRPIGVYGLSKEAGEHEIRKILSEHIILRTAWVYGVHGNNFVKTMLRLGLEREEIGVVDDQFGCPTFAADLAEAILVAAQHVTSKTGKPWGTYHCCGQGSVSWYDFAREIFRIAEGKTPLKLQRLKAITTADYPTPVKRPAFSSLDCSKFEKTFGFVMQPWQQALADMLADFLGDKVKPQSS